MARAVLQRFTWRVWWVEDRLDLVGVGAVIEVTSTHSEDVNHRVMVKDEIRSSDGRLVLNLTGLHGCGF